MGESILFLSKLKFLILRRFYAIYKTFPESLEIFKALGSDVRIEILALLLQNGKMSMNELAEQLDITNGALTNHTESWKLQI